MWDLKHSGTKLPANVANIQIGLLSKLHTNSKEDAWAGVGTLSSDQGIDVPESGTHFEEGHSGRDDSGRSHSQVKRQRRKENKSELELYLPRIEKEMSNIVRRTRAGAGWLQKCPWTEAPMSTMIMQVVRREIFLFFPEKWGEPTSLG